MAHSYLKNEKVNYSNAILLIAFLLFNFLNVNAQESTNSSGGNITGSGGSSSYSIGQLVYNIHNGSTGYELQGVQQPYEISIISTTKETDNITLTVSVFPNPTTTNIKLSIVGVKTVDYSYQLYDISATIIEEGKITSNEKTIEMQHLSSGTYLLTIIQRNKKIKTYKIIKN